MFNCVLFIGQNKRIIIIIDILYRFEVITDFFQIFDENRKLCVFEPFPFGGLETTYTVHLRLTGKLYGLPISDK